MTEQKQPNISDLFSGIMGQLSNAGQGIKQTDWWQTYQYPETVNFDPDKLLNCARSALYAKALQGGTVNEVIQQRFYQVLNVSNLEELVKGLDGRLVYSYEDSLKYKLFYIFSDGAIFASGDEAYKDYGAVQITIISLDKKKIDLFRQHYQSCFSFKGSK
jgi:hypothetical protein